MKKSALLVLGILLLLTLSISSKVLADPEDVVLPFEVGSVSDYFTGNTSDYTITSGELTKTHLNGYKALFYKNKTSTIYNANWSVSINSPRLSEGYVKFNWYNATTYYNIYSKNQNYIHIFTITSNGGDIFNRTIAYGSNYNMTVIRLGDSLNITNQTHQVYYNSTFFSYAPYNFNGTNLQEVNAYSASASDRYAYIYMDYTSTPLPASSTTINISYSSPQNGASFYTDLVNFNLTANLSYNNTNCSLFLNSSLYTIRNYSAGLSINISFNVTFTSEQEGSYNYSMACQDNTTYAATPTINFFVNRTHFTAIDLYNVSKNLTNFSMVVNGLYYNSSNGLIRFIPNGTQTLIFLSNESGGYLNRTYENHNTSLDLLAELYQYELHLAVRDSVSSAYLNSFNVNAPLRNYSGVAGNSSIYLNSQSLNYSLLISSVGYESQILVINVTPMTIAYANISLNPYLNVTILKEKTNSYFNTSLVTSSTKLIVYCSNSSLEYEFNKSADPNNQIYVPVTCPWQFLSVNFDYNTSSYYRTLIPSINDRAVNFYAIDLNEDLAYQILLKINDITGEFTDGTAIIRKSIGGSTVTIIEQDFDIENKAVLYLLKDGLYTVSIRSREGVERSLGYLVADAAGTKTITIPEINFVPIINVGEKISWSWNSSNSSRIHLIYTDSSDEGTSNITFYIKNGSYPSQIIYTTSSFDVSAATFTYIVSGNYSYIACFSAFHIVTGNLNECKSFSEGSLLGFSGYSTEEWAKITNWSCIIFLVFFIMLFSSHVGVGLGLASLLMYIFIKWGWLTFGSSSVNSMILAIVAVFAVITFYLEGDRK